MDRKNSRSHEFPSRNRYKSSLPDGSAEPSGMAEGKKWSKLNKNVRKVNKESSKTQNFKGRSLSPSSETNSVPQDRRQSGGVGNRNNSNINRDPFSFKRLERLADGDFNDIIEAIGNKNKGFEDFLKSKPRKDLVFLIMKIINKVCSSEFVRSQSYVLTLVCCDEFINHLKNFLTDMLTETNTKRKDTFSEFYLYLLNFFEKVFQLLPNTSKEKLSNLFVVSEVTMQSIGPITGIKLDSALFDNFNKLKQQFNEIGKNDDKISAKIEMKSFQPPPNDFRNISVFPTPDDLIEDQTYLRPNIVTGSYIDPYHYLDVQFRLLREDFIDPLRRGIKWYIKSLREKMNTKCHDIRIYKNVIIKPNHLHEKKTSLKAAYIVDFSENNFYKKINWENSKRLIYGSLLLFSEDNFHTFILGTVEDRNSVYLNKGIVSVILYETEMQNCLGKRYVMAESSVYFEPYFHVLSCLQTMGFNSLPMQNYILVQNSNINLPPAYLMKNGSICSIERFDVDLLNPDSWPTPSALRLDVSQFEAFKAALTREFVVIQGPPGTGKTHMGLLIAKMLLNNYSLIESPLLVVCYTNHALDQFLEGLLPFTNDIVRVGGQSRNEALAQLNIQKRRIANRNFSRMRLDIINSLSDVKKELDMKKSLHFFMMSKQGILGINAFSNVIDHDQFEELKNKGYLNWLIDVHIDQIDKEPGSSEIERNEEDACLFDDMDDINVMRQINNIDFYDLDGISFNSCNNDKIGAITFESISCNIEFLEKEIVKFNNKHLSRSEHQQFNNTVHLLETYKRGLYFLNEMMKYLTAGNISPTKNYETLKNLPLWSLPFEDRWALYGYWEGKLMKKLSVDLSILVKENDAFVEQLNEINEMANIATIKNTNIKVIGMTTTGAAKHQYLLRSLGPKIVIVEEAAEVLEAHILVALTNQCEHLILIGDHKQLHPNPAAYKIAKDYHLDISLFERMIKNGMNAFSLTVQHRMRKEISALITPAIYESLYNDESVLDYPSIRGIKHNLFFIDHDKLEQSEEDSGSHINKHEADFLLALCKYLILQDYSAEDITILTTYSGQQFYMRQKRKDSKLLKGVRIAVVDNYQGEENKIILLSLVRSNAAKNIGFLKTENRVCVALSRAKHGMYIIGNMSCLKESTIWQKINQTLESQNAIGSELLLECQIHHKITNVHCAEDFENVAEGGCDVLCNQLLGCGHTCKQLCHITNREHTDYKCFEKCQREICPNFGHPCPKFCHEKCTECLQKVNHTLDCGHENEYFCHLKEEELKCPTLVDVTLELCGHKLQKHCHRDINTVKCHNVCDTRLECGHACTLNCHRTVDPDHIEYKCFKECALNNKNCQLNHRCSKRCFEDCGECLVLVNKVLPCGHVTSMACSFDVNEFLCQKPCKRLMDCGHKCKLQCCKPCENCKVQIEKRIPECGHTIKAACSASLTRNECQKPCERIRSCGHKCKGLCKWDCSNYKCEELVRHPVVPACGHDGYVPCFIWNKDIEPTSDLLLMNCQAQCNEMLPCGDKCTGTCGECMQGRIHAVCKSKCGNVLICGHMCNEPCREICPPCLNRCMYKCKHSKCMRQCGNPCKPCAEKCDWKCQHLECKKNCGELCDRPPCNKPCMERLQKCGHPCVGFCSEPCPPLCRICDEEELTEPFFGTEDEPDARFVLLEDCGHVFESTSIDRWVCDISSKNGNQEIGFISCPKCKTYIQNTKRYNNTVKSTYMDVQLVKTKIFGQISLVKEKQRLLSKALMTLTNKAEMINEHLELNYFEKISDNLFDILQPYRQATRGMIQISLAEFVIEYLQKLYYKLSEIDYVKLTTNRKGIELIENRANLLMYHLFSRGVKISIQEMEQFSMELSRFYRIVDFSLLIMPTELNFLKEEKSINDLVSQISKECFSIRKFTKKCDDNLVQMLTELKRALNSRISLTSKDIQMIHMAMSSSFHSNYKQGHWYKCANGHPYCITECGGAMETSTCPECKQPIGGRDHTLLATNRVDSRIAGGRYGAWSEEANMRHNFVAD